MRVGQMFPSKTLDGRDLFEFAPNGAVVTIERVDFKTFDASKPGDAEIAYYLHTREFAKPFKIGRMNAETIEQILGTDETDDWTGRCITIRGMSKKIADRDNKGRMKVIWIVDVDIVAPTTPPSIAPKTDISGIFASKPKAALGQGPTEVIGIEQAAKVLSSLKERGKSFEDLADHLKALAMGGLIAGKIPPQWPPSVLPLARSFCTGTPKSAPKPSDAEIDRIKQAWAAVMTPAGAAPAEVIDKRTGEVIQAKTPGASSPSQPDDEIREEDIPF